MTQEKIQRINALAAKAKNEGLNEAEKTEQQELRREYLAEIRKSFAATLDNTYIQTPDGRKTKLEKKQ